MKNPALIVFAFFALLRPIQAAQTATARLFCYSVRFAFAGSGGPNAIYSLDFTSINAGNNGELYPNPDTPGRTHLTFLTLTDEIFEEEMYGTMELDVLETDSDGDGFPDFFDTARAVSGTTSGTYNFPGLASGNVTALWSREAGSQLGTCRLTLQNFGEPFFHSFTILEYRGPLTYTPGTNVVTAQASLTLTGDPNSKLKGPITFTKSLSDPYNDFDFDEGLWTNTVADPPQTFSFLNGFLARDANWPTNYYSYYYYFEFEDWDFNTAERDYVYWRLSIDDLNDADHDGIPDFSDDPQVIAPRAPVLRLNNNVAGNLSLTIGGNIGQNCEIQDASSIDATTWSTILSVTLTNDPQTVSLPLPTSGTRFWRVRTP